MALVTKAPDASADADSAIRTPHHIGGDLYAGVDIPALAPCYIKAADGKAYPSDGTAANEAAKFDGFTIKAYKAGQAMGLYGAGLMFKYSAPGTLTPGTDLFIAAGGGLDTAATTGGTVAIARAINDRDVRCTRFAA